MSSTAVTFQLHGDTAANWLSTNPILLAREPGVETDTGKLKFGDGTTRWSALGYIAGSGSSAPLFDVTNPAYGAKGDAKTINDAAITAGQATLTSTSANFTLADVNKTVIVNGAGSIAISGAGSVSVGGVTTLPASTLTTTIQSFVNATTVTLATTASNTVATAQCVYGTDDTTHIQAAINAAAAASAAFSGAKVNVIYPAGFTFIHGQLTILSGIRLWAYGATIQASNLTWSSKGFLYAGATITQGSVVQNFDIFGGTWRGSGGEVESRNMKWFLIGSGLGLADCTIQDVTLTGWGVCPVLITNPTRVKFLDSHLFGNEFNESGFNNSLDFVCDGLAPFGGEILVRGVNYHNSVADGIALVVLVPDAYSGPVRYTVTECVGTADAPAPRTGCQTQILQASVQTTTTLSPTNTNPLPVTSDPVAAGFLTCGQINVGNVAINYTGLSSSPAQFTGCTVASGVSNKTINAGTNNIAGWFVLDPNCVVGDYLKYISGPNTAKLSQIVSVVQGVGYTLAVAPSAAASGLTLYVGVYRNCIQLEVDAQGFAPVTDFTFSNNDVTGYERAVIGVSSPAAHTCTRGLITGNRATNGQINAGGQWQASNSQGSCVSLSGSSAAHSVTITDNDLTSASAPLVPEISYGVGITNNAPQSNNNFTSSPTQGLATLVAGTATVPTAEIRAGDDVRLDVVSPSGTRGLVQLGAINGTLTATLTSGSPAATLAAGSIPVPNPGTLLSITGAGIPTGTTLTVTSPTAGTLSANATANETTESVTVSNPGFISGTLTASLIQGTLALTVGNGLGTGAGSVTLGSGSIPVPTTGTVLSLLSAIVVGGSTVIPSGTTLTIDSPTTGHLSVNATGVVTAQTGSLGVISPVPLAAGSIPVPANGTVLGIVGSGIAQGSTLTINTSTTGTLSLAAIAPQTSSPVAVGNFTINAIQPGTINTLQTGDTSGVRYKIDH